MEENLDEKSEIWLIPETVDSVQKIYNAMSECALLNPDPLSDGEEDGFFTAENVLEKFDSMLNTNGFGPEEGQFDDPEEKKNGKMEEDTNASKKQKLDD
jgi:hypothetical protein